MLIAVPDQRGKKTPSNKTSVSVVNAIEEHIRSFPKYSSHYGRRDSNRLYLNPSLSISKMYQLYEASCSTNNTEPASLWVYQRIFNLNFNLHFYKPKKDACTHCDIYNTKLMTDLDSDEREATELLRDEHQARGRYAHDQLQTDVKQSQADVTLKVFSFDLERTLPTLHLNTNDVFYLRHMWTYNLGIHGYPEDKGYMNMWHECNGKRGSVEVASCVVDHIAQLPNITRRVNTFSDYCGGQNRNFPMASAMIYVVNSIENIQMVDMKFMESGHSFLPNDTDFGAVSRAQKRRSAIYTPQDWEDLVKTANDKKQFDVKHRIRESFRDWKTLDSLLINRKKNEDGDPVRSLQIKWMRFCKGNMKMLYRENLCEGPFKSVNFLRNIRTLATSLDVLKVFNIPPAYPTEIKLKKKKFNDLMKLLKYIPPIHHNFYQSLPQYSSGRNDSEIELHPNLEDSDGSDEQ